MLHFKTSIMGLLTEIWEIFSETDLKGCKFLKH